MKKTVLIALLLVVVLALAALIGLRVFGARGSEAAPPPSETSAVSENVPAAETEQPAIIATPDPALTSEDAASGGGTDTSGD